MLTATRMHVTHLAPSQINTREPIRGHGPLPRASATRAGDAYPMGVVPLLECPCTTRTKKVIQPGTEDAPFGQGVGTIDGVPYSPACHAPPLTSVLADRNPSCDVRTYVGGIQCCGHETILLDADQAVPPDVDEVRYRWRFYVREYRPATDTEIFDLTWYVNAAEDSIEYDVPAAPPDVPAEHAVHVITSNFSGLDFIKRSHDVDLERARAGIRLAQMGGHCHSPSCLSIELRNADTGETICEIKPVSGKGAAPLDELHYLYLPPCMWSMNASEG